MQMYLYDGTSDVDFFYAGTMTHAEISEDPSLADLVSAPCVLYDDGAGRVYRFDRLDVLADRYGIDMTDDAEQTFASVLSAMEKIPPDRAEQALEMAETAQQAADEAKEIAEQGGDPALAQFVTLALPMVAPTVKDSAIAPVLKWAPGYVESGHEYQKGDVFIYTDGTYWRCSSDFTSQEQWKPGDAGLLSLFYEIILAADGIIVCQDVRGEFDAPDAGDLRHFPDADGPVYRSLVNDNAYSPEAVPSNWELA